MNIAIIGLGLIGGSLGLALKRAGRPDLRIVGIPRRPETLERALALGAIDQGTTDLARGVAEADLVFICTPIHLIVPILQQIAPALKKGAIVTDVGSSKQEVVRQAEQLMRPGTHFVGGHPMAGKETTKLEAADPALFQGKKWILTRSSRTGKKALAEVGQVIRATGAELLEMEPKVHDQVVALISHLPLALAVALTNTVNSDAAQETAGHCAASGFRDTTRVASGDPTLGLDMFVTNQKAVLKALAAFRREIKELERMIKARDGQGLCAALSKAKGFRDSLYG